MRVTVFDQHQQVSDLPEVKSWCFLWKCLCRSGLLYQQQAKPAFLRTPYDKMNPFSRWSAERVKFKGLVHMATLERARAKHNEKVEQLNKTSAKLEKMLEAVVRLHAKKAKDIRAVARSEKRMQKLRAAAVHNTGPTATVVDKVLTKVKTKVAPPVKLDDPVPTFKPTSPPGNSASTPRARKQRRTPDDFKAEMDARNAG